jgi:plastocyanin
MGGAQHTEQSPALMGSRGRLAALALGATLALPAAGCGDDERPVRPRDGTLDVRLDDFLIEPQRVRAKPGRITFRARNEGRIGHTLRVLRGNREVAAVKTMTPGERGEATATLARGEYDLVCVLGNHKVLGMYGTLVVR